EWQCQAFEKRAGILSELNTDDSDYALERNLATNIFRVYQEALTNIPRHAKATAVTTSLTRTDTPILLQVSDNCIGFEMENARRKNTLGLVGMRERAILFQGELTVQSRPGEGTSVILSVPLTINHSNTA